MLTSREILPLPQQRSNRKPHGRMTQQSTQLRQCLDTVRRSVRAQQMWLPRQRILLACSGGADSMAALGLLQKLQPSLGHTLTVAHVHHGLYAHADAAEALVAQTCREKKIPYLSQHLQLQHGADLEARCRDARYIALKQMQIALQADLIVTAHHADDQAETFLMRAIRGASPNALQGVRAVRPDGVVRPFLHLTKAQLLTCKDEMQLDHIDDLSNLDGDFTRNRLRAEVLPLLERVWPGAIAGLARTAALISAEQVYPDFWLLRALQPHMAVEENAISVPRDQLPNEGIALAALLQAMCRQLSLPAPSQKACEQVLLHKRANQHTACHIHGLTIDCSAQTWRFSANLVAREPSAD